MGCAHRIAWETRIGTYTFDQAVLEFGPPDRSAILTDGTQVCEWRLAPGGRTITYYGMGGYGWGGYGPWGGWYGYGGPVLASESTGAEQVLRLTFGPDKILRNAGKVYR